MEKLRAYNVHTTQEYMTTPKRCPTCKSTDRVTQLRHPMDGYMKWACWSCTRDSIPEGSTIAMFDNRMDRSRWYIPITSEHDLNEMERIGTWAQEQGKNSVGFYVYTNWRIKTGCGPVSFSFGHENSMKFLAERIEYLRERLPVPSEKLTEVSPEVFQGTLDF